MDYTSILSRKMHRMWIYFLVVILALLTAAFETYGAFAAGKLWQDGVNSWFWIFGIGMGFGSSVFIYVVMRRYVPDLLIAQTAFIAGIALFPVLLAVWSEKTVGREVVLGLLLVATGAMLITSKLR